MLPKSIIDISSLNKPDWCPGCGDYGILMALKKALLKLSRPLNETCIVTGIGCGSKINHFVKTHGFEGIHGRTLPVAMGIHLANHSLNVVAMSGDGDGYGIGMEHFMHALRRNMNLTYIVHNNQIYGLTKGQYSPTSQKGMKSASSPDGALEAPVNPIKLALASDAVSFIARGFAGDIEHLSKLILAGMKHRGFSLIDVLQPCVTFNRLNTYAFFKSRVYKLEEDKSYNPTNRKMAIERAEEWDKRIPTGIFYSVKMECYEDALDAIKEKPLVNYDISKIDIAPLLKELC